MADKKISQLTEKTSIVFDDLLAIVDSEVIPTETKRLKFSTLISGAFTEVTIDAAGEIAITTVRHTVDTFGDAATDNLDTISGLAEGQLVILTAENAARVVTIRHGIDNIYCPNDADIVLNDVYSVMAVGIAGGDVLVMGGGGTELEDTPTNGELTKAPTSNWAYDHNAAVLSSTVHNNNNQCQLYSNEILAGLQNSVVHKWPTLTASYDPLSAIVTTDWYGATGAYTQADGAGCSNVNIRKVGAAFPSSILYTVVRSASDAAGTLNLGIHIITARPDADNLTIVKLSGVNFANSYYFWIKHAEWTPAVTGLYLVTGQQYYNPAEADKFFTMRLYEINGTSAPTLLKARGLNNPVAGDAATPFGFQVTLTASRPIFVAAYFVGTSGVPSHYGSSTACPLEIFLLKQTA